MDTDIIKDILERVSRLKTLRGEPISESPAFSPIVPHKPVPRGPRVAGEIWVQSHSPESRARAATAQKAPLPLWPCGTWPNAPFMGEEDGYNRLSEWLMGDPEAEDHAKRVGLLVKRGLSVEALARKMGLTRAAVYYYLTDHGRPSVKALVKMCDILEVSLAEGASYVTPRNPGRQWASKP